MEFHVEGMTCGHCAKAITAALRALDPQARVDIDLAAGSVTAEGRFDAERARAAIEEAGYAATLLADAGAAQAADAGCCGHCHA